VVYTDKSSITSQLTYIITNLENVVKNLKASINLVNDTDINNIISQDATVLSVIDAITKYRSAIDTVNINIDNINNYSSKNLKSKTITIPDTLPKIITPKDLITANDTIYNTYNSLVDAKNKLNTDKTKLQNLTSDFNQSFINS
jgi:hypothetical protein